MRKIIPLTGLLLLIPTVPHAEDLVQIYERAAERDPRVREAEERRDAALEARPQGIARLLPTLTATGSMNRNSVKAKFANRNLIFLAGSRNVGFWNSSASLNLVQPVYHHEYWVQLGQADNTIAEAEATYAAEQQSLILRTARAYFDVLLDQDSLEFAEAEQRAIERQLEQAKARFEVGLVAITDLNEAQAGYDQARANVIQTENQLDNAKEALREIVGEYAGNLAGLKRDPPLHPPQPESMEEWHNLALQDNLSLIAAQNRTDAAKKTVEIQFAGHLPTLDIVGAAGFTDTNRPFGIPTEYQAIGMEVNIPMFAGGAVSSKVRQAQHEYEAARENLDGKRRAVTREIKQAYRGILSSISRVKALKAAAVSAGSALEATEAGFEVGTRTMVDVLTEQRNLYAAKRNYAEARYNYIVNSLTLKQTASRLRPEDLALVNAWLHDDRTPGTGTDGMKAAGGKAKQ